MDSLDWAVASLGVLLLLISVAGMFFPRLRFLSALAEVLWLPLGLRRALILKIMSMNRSRLKQKGITVYVVSEDQVAVIEDLPDYERAIQALQWMQREAGEVEFSVGDFDTRPGFAYPESFTAYTGPRGDYIDGRRVGDDIR